MGLRMKQFTPPKGTLGGEWDEVAGLIPSPEQAYKANSIRRVSLFLYKSYKTCLRASPGLVARVSYAAPAHRPVTSGQGYVFTPARCGE